MSELRELYNKKKQEQAKAIEQISFYNGKLAEKSASFIESHKKVVEAINNMRNDAHREALKAMFPETVDPSRFEDLAYLKEARDAGVKASTYVSEEASKALM